MRTETSQGRPRAPTWISVKGSVPLLPTREVPIPGRPPEQGQGCPEAAGEAQPRGGPPPASLTLMALTFQAPILHQGPVGPCGLTATPGGA